jgi:hypothetical protein
MRFCLVSTHTDQTIGYSKVSGNILKELSKNSLLNPEQNVKLFHFGFQRHVAKTNLKKVPEGVISYDASANEDPKEEGFGFNKFKEYLDMVQPDVVMIYNDIITISKFLDVLMSSDKNTNLSLKEKELNQQKSLLTYDVSLKPSFKIWLYLDVMYKNMHPTLLKKVFQITDRIYVFSETGKSQMKLYNDIDLYGIVPEIKVLEHSVDSSVFFPLKSIDHKYISREKLGIPSNAIVFLNCNRNSGRKRLDHSVMAFARLLSNSKVNHLPLYFIFATGGVSGKGGQPYYDIPRMFVEELKKCNLNEEFWKKRLLLVDTNINVIHDEGINELYNICDIGVNTSTGEGFGLCTFEHMVANGAAQIVNDIGCYSQYLSTDTDTLALIVPTSGHGYFDTAQSAFGFEYPIFDLKDITKAFEDCVLNLEKWKQKSKLLKLKSWSEIMKEFWEDLIRFK